MIKQSSGFSVAVRSFLKARLRSGMSHALGRVYEEVKLGRMHRRSLKKATRFVADSTTKLHCGCGDNLKSGWINIDPSNASADLQLDLRENFPFTDNSVSMIYSEHFFEHLEYPKEATRFLAECLRVLVSGGEFRVVVPDTEWPLISYANGEDEYFKLARVRWHPLWCNTRIHNINYHFRQGSEHKYAYDYETLAKVLHESGFVSIERSQFNADLDTEHRRIGSLYATARKA